MKYLCKRSILSETPPFGAWPDICGVICLCNLNLFHRSQSLSETLRCPESWWTHWSSTENRKTQKQTQNKKYMKKKKIDTIQVFYTYTHSKTQEKKRNQLQMNYTDKSDYAPIGVYIYLNGVTFTWKQLEYCNYTTDGSSRGNIHVWLMLEIPWRLAVPQLAVNAVMQTLLLNKSPS